jgi:small GTP-binding protein
MALLNSNKKEINAKIVYYGPGLSGKTTNIQYIYKKLKPEHKGKLMTLATQTDRTLFFDFLPVELGEIKGMKVRFQLYTVPGQVFYNATRRLVLKNVDGIVFVATAERDKMYDNIESFKNLEENIQHYGRKLTDIPLVIQYNKMDLPNVYTVEELQKELNKLNVPYFEASASTGVGVLQTLTGITKLVVHRLKTQTSIAEADKTQEKELKEIQLERSEQIRTEQPQAKEQPAKEAEQPHIQQQTKDVITTQSRKTLNVLEVGKPEVLSDSTIIVPVVAIDENKSQYELKITIKF